MGSQLSEGAVSLGRTGVGRYSFVRRAPKPRAMGAHLCDASERRHHVGTDVCVVLGGARERWQSLLDSIPDLEAFSYYQLLGVSPDASADEVGDAYYEIARVAHPDRHVREPEPRRRRSIELLYARLSEAFWVLSDPEQRREYDRDLRGGFTRLKNPHPKPAGVRIRDPRTRKARELYTQARQLLSDNDPERARVIFELAQQFEPSSSAIRAAIEELASSPSSASDNQAPRADSAAPQQPESAYSGSCTPPAEDETSTTEGDVATGAEPEPSGAERRRDPRHSLIHPMRVRCRTWSEFRTFYTRDISRGGVFLRTTTPPPVGTSVRISLALPDQRAVELRATVVHVVPPGTPEETAGMGLRFLDLTDEQRARIDQLLSVASAAEGTADHHQLRRELLQELSRLREASAHMALRVPPDADPDLVRKAYLHLAKRSHPDLYCRFPGDGIQNAASEIFFLIRRAYERMRDSRAHTATAATTTVDAAAAVARARCAWQASDYATAVAWMRRAVDIAPKNPYMRAAYHAASGAAARAAGNPSVARKHFESALVFDRGCKVALAALTSEDVPRDASALFGRTTLGEESS